MAAKSITILSTWSDGKRTHVTGYAEVQDNYPAGGDSFFLGDLAPVGSSPHHVAIQPCSGYAVEGVPTRDSPAFKAKFFSAVDTELAVAPYPAGITGTILRFHAIFDQLI